MIEIDGSFGEGGGQILRTALSLAAITGKSVHFTKIRANRRKPGLMRQHRICAQAAAEITGGTLSGAELNSQEMTFVPGKIRGGDYHFNTASAGSTLLIAQSILPVLLLAPEPSRMILEGGTHAANAPIFDFFDRVFLPCLRRMGAEVKASLDRIGFYPVGGGKIVLEIEPLREWRKLELTEGGKILKGRIISMGSGVDREILEDEVRLTREGIGGNDWETEIRQVEAAPQSCRACGEDGSKISAVRSGCGEFSCGSASAADGAGERRCFSHPPPEQTYTDECGYHLQIPECRNRDEKS